VTHVYAEVPDAMVYLLAEFHKVCMYTVPKHLHALNVSLNVIELFSIAVFKVVKNQKLLCIGVAIS
jgi:nucleoporin GLE1